MLGAPESEGSGRGRILQRSIPRVEHRHPAGNGPQAYYSPGSRPHPDTVRPGVVWRPTASKDRRQVEGATAVVSGFRSNADLTVKKYNIGMRLAMLRKPSHR